MNTDTTTDANNTLEIRKSELTWRFVPLLEWCALGVMLYQMRHHPFAWFLFGIIAITYLHVQAQATLVVIDFDKKLATFHYPKYLVFKKPKSVSLSEYSLVYLSGHHHHNTWSIHFSNRTGAHLRLINVVGLYEVLLDFDKARDTVERIAKGLGIPSAHFI